MGLTKDIYKSIQTGQVKANNTATRTQINALNSAYNNYATTQQKLTNQQNKQLTASTKKQIQGTRQQVQKQYDVNAINQAIQYGQIEERMANMGLSKSGLNVTQQTALGTQRINADNSVTQSYNNAVSTLRSNLQTARAENNRTLNSNLSSANLSNQQNIASIKAENAKDNASLTTTAKSNSKTNAQKIISSVSSSNGKSTNASTIFAAENTYKLSSGSLKYLLKIANISASDYAKWKKNRNFFQADTSSSSSGSGSSKRSYSSNGSGSNSSKTNVEKVRSNEELGKKYRIGRAAYSEEGQVYYINRLYKKGSITKKEYKNLLSDY